MVNLWVEDLSARYMYSGLGNLEPGKRKSVIKEETHVERETSWWRTLTNASSARLLYQHGEIILAVEYDTLCYDSP